MLKIAPRAGAWIEIQAVVEVVAEVVIAPRAGAWIEITSRRVASARTGIAPRAGAWIEISHRLLSFMSTRIAARAGAWIEITKTCDSSRGASSHLVQVRGLKYPFAFCQHVGDDRTSCRCVD